MTADSASTEDRGAREDVDEPPERERYRELLEELRTVLPGVQVLFAFLLMVPFNQRFEELDALGRNAFGVALGASALATAFFVAPPWYHRRDGDLPRSLRLRRSIAFQVAGLTTLGVAMAVAVFLVTRFIFGTGIGTTVGGGFVAAAVILWWLIPTLDQARRR